MKKNKNVSKKLRLGAETLQVLSNEQAKMICGGMPNTGNLTDVPPNCGTWNCSP